MKGDIQRIFQEFGDDYIGENRGSLTEQHVKVIRAIQKCGTPECGWIGFHCLDCGKPHYIERCCGNRLCPTCQHDKTRQWLDKRLREQLPTHYFMITFTVPEQLRPFLLHKPKEGYAALFKAASGALKKLAGNERFLGADLPGFFGVLHTWGRTVNYHPHIHFVVPGGGVDTKKGLWRSAREDFYAPWQGLAKVFKGVFREQMQIHELESCIDPCVWYKKWKVDCQAAGQNREGVLKYLAPYVFKTAITDRRIVAVGNGKVIFSYLKSGSNRPRRMTLDVKEFIRRYLIHVLPSGFMRIRRYGFMGSGCTIPHQELVALVRMAQGFEVDAVEYTAEEQKPFRCPACGGRLVCELILNARGGLLAAFRPPFRKRE